MLFAETEIAGVWIVTPEFRRDDRGDFARTFCANEFAAHGLATTFVQVNTSFNRHKGTIRGLHFQIAPSAETKLVRCTRGAIVDVAVDVRPDSPTYLRHVSVELSVDNGRALYVPQGFAHGYQTLADDSEVLYQVDAFYAPECERGLRYDDPALAIRWPLPPAAISPKDAAWPLLNV